MKLITHINGDADKIKPVDLTSFPFQDIQFHKSIQSQIKKKTKEHYSILQSISIECVYFNDLYGNKPCVFRKGNFKFSNKI